MTGSPLFNVAAQMVAAFLIFVTGFAALFAALVVSSGVIWLLWRCVDRLSALTSLTVRSRWMLESKQSALPAAAQSRSTADRELIVTTPRL